MYLLLNELLERVRLVATVLEQFPVRNVLHTKTRNISLLTQRRGGELVQPPLPAAKSKNQIARHHAQRPQLEEGRTESRVHGEQSTGQRF